jgi:macrodomain Ter protein organizer (MatP/YcbG family)
MPKYIGVELSESQEAELEKVRHQHPKAYMRERAAAVLKVAAGETVTVVAEKSLLTRHEPETVHHWIKNYLAHGLQGWNIQSGRGRKAAFFPSKSGSSS